MASPLSSWWSAARESLLLSRCGSTPTRCSAATATAVVSASEPVRCGSSWNRYCVATATATSYKRASVQPGQSRGSRSHIYPWRHQPPESRGPIWTLILTLLSAESAYLRSHSGASMRTPCPGRLVSRSGGMRISMRRSWTSQAAVTGLCSAADVLARRSGVLTTSRPPSTPGRCRHG